MKGSSLLFLPGRFWGSGKVFSRRYFLTVFLSKPVYLAISLMLRLCEYKSRINSHSSIFSIICDPRAFLKDWKLGNFNPAKMRNYSPALTVWLDEVSCYLFHYLTFISLVWQYKFHLIWNLIFSLKVIWQLIKISSKLPLICRFSAGFQPYCLWKIRW